MQSANVVIVGAAGLVGQQIASVLAEHMQGLPVGELRLVASDRSAGHELSVLGRRLTVEAISPASFQGMDFAFFAAPNEVSAKYAPIAAELGVVAIDKSSHFRMQDGIPLVVPEVNMRHIGPADRIIASPNCSTIQLVMAIGPLDRAFGLRRVVVSTYQAVSGSGREALEGLDAEARDWADGAEPQAKAYREPIAFNVLAQCDSFLADGFTKEEHKLRFETRKILGRPDLPLAATAVRVPVRVGHSEAVTVEFARDVSPDEAREALRGLPGVRVVDDPGASVYPTPLAAAGQDDVFVGRIRQDPDRPDTLHMFVVADNLRKGAATNAVQIAEALWQSGM